MARGKQAVKSARRRERAAMEHVDKVTDRWVEAKHRARQLEAQALRAEQLEKENARLRALIEESTSDRVRELEAKLEEATAERDHALLRFLTATKAIDRLLDHARQHMGGTFDDFYAEMCVRGGLAESIDLVPVVDDPEPGKVRLDTKRRLQLKLARRELSTRRYESAKQWLGEDASGGAEADGGVSAAEGSSTETRQTPVEHGSGR